MHRCDSYPRPMPETPGAPARRFSPSLEGKQWSEMSILWDVVSNLNGWWFLIDWFLSYEWFPYCRN